MAKGKITGWIHEPLAAILGTRAKIAVLRILWRSSNPISYREVVRRSGMAYRSIDLALGELAACGLVEELAGGRERRVRLNPGHRLAPAITNLLHVDADYFAGLRIELRAIATAAVGDGLLAAAIVGAVARREEILGSELELVVVARDQRALESCRARFDHGGAAIAGRFGVRLKVIGYDVGTAQAMWRTRTPAAIRAVEESESLVGPPLKDVLSG